MRINLFNFESQKKFNQDKIKKNPPWVRPSSWVRAFILFVQTFCWGTTIHFQGGALSLVGIVEIMLSLVESFIELKYFHNVATP